MNELKKSNDQKSETISHDSDTVEIMMNESRTSNNHYDSDTVEIMTNESRTSNNHYDSDTVEIINESRTSNNQKSESISYESDSDSSVVYKFVEDILLSRAKELTNSNRLERKDESPVELFKVNTETIMMPPKTNKRKVSNLK